MAEALYSSRTSSLAHSLISASLNLHLLRSQSFLSILINEKASMYLFTLTIKCCLGSSCFFLYFENAQPPLPVLV
ncbi:ORF1067 [White spot syndrome virus]|uniref:ORF1067 n=1 Tax=White spot syndrome virus TaxID=342409 RepID=A0A2D3I6B6_9VIRU|nr:ORF1067 [White spot syndrome virus]